MKHSDWIKPISLEEKYVTLQSELKKQIWQSISFKNSKQMLSFANDISKIRFAFESLSLENVIVFFMDFFNILLRCKFIEPSTQELFLFKKILYDKGVNVFIDNDQSFDCKVLSYKHNDMDLFYPVKILQKVLFAETKEFVNLIDFLTAGDFPQDCIISKWMKEYCEDRYLEDFNR